MNKILNQIPSDLQNYMQRQKQPGWSEPMLAKLTHNVFSNDDWIFERKLDGERCLAFKKGSTVYLKSRNKKNLNNTYPEIAKLLSGQNLNSFIADGEIVAFKKNVTSFSRLQNRIQIKDKKDAIKSNIKVYYYIFDLIHLEEYDITELPLRVRKTLLKNNFSFNNTIKFTVHRNAMGKDFYNDACSKGWEGLIAKKADSKYLHKRSSDWLKFKCSNQQEFVICGFTDPEGKRIGFGSLLIGYYENNELEYAGKVGTGFDEETLKKIRNKLDKNRIKKSPFSKADINEKNSHWVSPKIICEIGFTEWTNSGKLRHPRFLGLRNDKAPKEVIKEK